MFRHILRRSVWPLLFWGAGAGVMAYLVVIIVPNVESLQQMAKLLETFPPALLEAFGAGEAKFLASPAGYLSLNLFSWILPVLAIYSILAGLAVTANEEDQGIMDIILSLPLNRWQIVVEKTLAYALIISGNVILTLAGLWIGVRQTPTMAVDTSRLMEASLNMIPSLLVVLAFTVLVSTLVRRNVAAGLASAFLIVGYFIDLIGRAAPGTFLDKLRLVSFYTYHDNPGVMQHGLAWGNIVGLLIAAALMIAVSVWTFERRDVGV
jgi:ABC-2 type transport system permease protein